ncbi:hypothetical protein [Novosphingobium sp. PASSN1]|uniref:hypothetical protein n=1 Tax=Novosphingobium sp. PASSN1 TaxID=2015561 RepID=UPI0025E6650A|nr:hypothetical protein [Novosphingobium sp. PASSN1]
MNAGNGMVSPLMKSEGLLISSIVPVSVLRSRPLCERSARVSVADVKVSVRPSELKLGADVCPNKMFSIVCVENMLIQKVPVGRNERASAMEASPLQAATTQRQGENIFSFAPEARIFA